MENKCIRVLQIIRTMNIGGAETFIMNIYKNIDRTKVQFDFLVNGEGSYDSEIEELGGRVYRIRYITEIGQNLYKKELKEFFYKHPEYKIIHSHIDQVSGIILETARRCNVPVRISHSHNTKNSNGIIGKIYKKYLQNKINKNSTIKLACGKDAAKWLYRKEADKAIIIHNGVDIDKYSFNENNRKQIRKELNISEDAVVIGNIGRFSKQKNHNFLIDIFYEYQKNNKAVLILVGNGDLKEEIENKVRKLRIADKVKFLGIRRDTEKIYSSFDVMIYPSLYEGLSVAMVEAQCNGLKVLASSTVDKQTNISGNIYFESLKNPAKQWANDIMKMELSRIDVKKLINQGGYNIKECAIKMQEIYLNGVNNEYNI